MSDSAVSMREIGGQSGGGLLADGSWVAADPRRWSVAVHAGKRILDVLIAGSALIFLAPLLLVLCAAIRLESSGPSLFRQRRTGLNGQVFMIYKLRSMRVQEDGAEIRHASKNDSRVTRLGAFLRRASIDELPQLLNVLRGDMSIVGPRPHALSHDEKYAAAIPAYRHRFRAKPGLTGLAQVNGFRGEIHSLDCMIKRIEADNAYVDDWSFRRDIIILLRTAPLIVRDPRTY